MEDRIHPLFLSVQSHILLWAVLGFSCGITAAFHYPPLDTFPSLATTTGVITFVILAIISSILAARYSSFPAEKTTYRKILVDIAIITVAFFCTGFFHMSFQTQQREQVHAPLQSLPGEKLMVSVIGTVLNTPEISANSDLCHFLLQSEYLSLLSPKMVEGKQQAKTTDTKSSFLALKTRIQVNMPKGSQQHIVAGDRVLAMVRLRPIQGYQTPGSFNYGLHMAAKGVYYSGWISTPYAVVQLEKKKGFFFSPLQRISLAVEGFRGQIRTILQEHLDKDIAGVYQALLLGSKAALSPHIQEQFKASGCMHLLAISGLHITLLAGMSGFLFLTLLKRSQWLLLHLHVPTVAMLLTLPLLIGYALLAGMQTPVFRALVMAMAVCMAILCRRPYRLFPLLAAAALIILIWQPLSLFTPSFQLSFAAVIAIALSAKRITGLRGKKRSNERSALHSSPSWKMWATGNNLKILGIRIFQMLLVSFAATLGTLPFLLYYFHRFTLAGPVMNLIIEPLLCLWALPCGLFAIAVLPFSSELSLQIFTFGGDAIRIANTITAALTRIDGLSFWTIRPHLYEMVLYFLALVLFFCPLPLFTPHPAHLTQKENPYTRWKQVRYGAALSLLAVVLISFSQEIWWTGSGEKKMSITILDVGQGSAAFIQLPDGASILIDVGGSTTERFDPGEQIIAPFLWQRRIWHVDTIIISHPHSDHYAGLPFLYRHFRPHRILINGQKKVSWPYAEMLEKLRLQGASIMPLQAGQRIGHTKNTKNIKNIKNTKNIENIEKKDTYTVRCLGIPGLSHGLHGSNNQSLVILLEHGKYRFLLPGDIEKKAEHVLLQHGLVNDIDILVAAHHGSKTSTGREFLQATKPRVIIVSSGISQYGMKPARQHLQIWKKQGIQHLATGIDGTITVETNGEQIRLSDFHGRQWIWK